SRTISAKSASAVERTRTFGSAAVLNASIAHAVSTATVGWIAAATGSVRPTVLLPIPGIAALTQASLLLLSGCSPTFAQATLLPVCPLALCIARGLLSLRERVPASCSSILPCCAAVTVGSATPMLGIVLPCSSCGTVRNVLPVVVTLNKVVIVVDI